MDNRSYTNFLDCKKYQEIFDANKQALESFIKVVADNIQQFDQNDVQKETNLRNTLMFIKGIVTKLLNEDSVTHAVSEQSKAFNHETNLIFNELETALKQHNSDDLSLKSVTSFLNSNKVVPNKQIEESVAKFKDLDSKYK